MDLPVYLKPFESLRDEDRNRIQEKLRPLSFLKSEIILPQGAIQRDLYLIESGTQMSFYESEKKLHVVAFTYTGGVSAIPDSFCFQKISEFTLQAITDTECMALSYINLQILFNQSQAIERLFRRMTEQILAGVIQRHLELQTLSIEERFITFCKRSPHVLQEVPHKYIASYLDIDASNFSKLFNRIKI